MMEQLKNEDMTEEDYNKLDEQLTKTVPKLTNVSGIFAQQKELLRMLDDISATYIGAKAERENSTPTQIIREMVNKEIAYA
jgi:hypothetical protein